MANCELVLAQEARSTRVEAAKCDTSQQTTEVNNVNNTKEKCSEHVRLQNLSQFAVSVCSVQHFPYAVLRRGCSDHAVVIGGFRRVVVFGQSIN